MSFRPEKLLEKSLKSYDLSPDFIKQFAGDDLQSIYLELLYNGIHGFCISPYEEGQKPGDILTEAQLSRRIKILKKHSQWIRSFSCIEGNELIPKIAKQNGLKTMVGAWLGSDEEKNKQEIENLIQLCNDGYVDVAAVGNEVLYRKDLDEKSLLDYIRYVKQKVKHIPVGYVDAYYEFTERPAIAEACDIILCNCYPFWEGTHIDNALNHMKSMYYQAREAGKGKKVIITETGWPSAGQNISNAMPGLENAMRYFINSQLWAHDEDIEMFYFSSFDETWKTGSEGDVGAHWGIWDKEENLKLNQS